MQRSMKIGETRRARVYSCETNDSLRNVVHTTHFDYTVARDNFRQKFFDSFFFFRGAHWNSIARTRYFGATVFVVCKSRFFPLYIYTRWRVLEN